MPPMFPTPLMGLKSASPDFGASPSDSDKSSPDEAGYQPPEQGPFHCAGCIHFHGPSSCELVAGSIDPEGCCNLYHKGAPAGGTSTPVTPGFPPPGPGGNAPLPMAGGFAPKAPLGMGS